MSITSEIVCVTPKTAGQWLESQHGSQRPLNKRNLAAMVRDMKNGDWCLTGEPIILTTAGELSDGQHRLTAMVQADVTLDLMVVRGIHKSAYTRMNTGKSRTASDVLHSAGYIQTSILASISRMVYETEKSDNGALCLSTNHNPTSAMILKLVKDNPGLVDTAREANRLRKVLSGMISPAVVGVLLWYFSMIDESAADEFFTAVCHGSNLELDDPCLVLRNRLLAQKGARRIGRTEVAALTVIAWNKFINNKPCSKNGLFWRRFGPTAMPFPVFDPLPASLMPAPW